jgi:hypothetical protein
LHRTCLLLVRFLTGIGHPLNQVHVSRYYLVS